MDIRASHARNAIAPSMHLTPFYKLSVLLSFLDFQSRFDPIQCARWELPSSISHLVFLLNGAFLSLTLPFFSFFGGNIFSPPLYDSFNLQIWHPLLPQHVHRTWYLDIQIFFQRNEKKNTYTSIFCVWIAYTLLNSTPRREVSDLMICACLQPKNGPPNTIAGVERTWSVRRMSAGMFLAM